MSLQCDLRDPVIIAESGEPYAHGAIAHDGGLQRIGCRFANAGRILTRAAPAEGGEHIRDGRDPGKIQAGPVALVARAGQHPAATRLAEADGVAHVTASVDVEADLLGAEGLARGREHRVHDLLRTQSARGRGDVKRARSAQLRIRGALIGVRVQDDACEMLRAVTGADEFSGQPLQQLGMCRLALFPIGHGFDDASSHEARPDAVGHDLREALVLRRGDEGGKTVALVLGILGQFLADGFRAELIERPLRFDLAAGLQAHRDERLTTVHRKAIRCDTARDRHRKSFRFEHRGQLKQILLRALAGW